MLLQALLVENEMKNLV